MSPALQRLTDEGAVEQLLSESGRMAELGSEDGVPRLDWVRGVERLLNEDGWLEQVEREAAQIRQLGIRHIIWSGMGGSIMAVRVLIDLGCFQSDDTVTIHPLDSTDPAALNTVVRTIAAAKHLPPIDTTLVESEPGLRRLFGDVMMVGVSMGLTSEEPITHLAWFTNLLDRAGLPIERHCLVMTLPDSYLERFAREHGFPSRPLQMDGGSGTGGRMSAPTTRVFLLPAAFALLGGSARPGQLRSVLRAAWKSHDPAGAVARPSDHPYVRLAVGLADAAVDGACRLMIGAHGTWRALIPWIEQLIEESLGKDGQGVVVFDDATLRRDGRCFRSDGSLVVHIGAVSGRESMEVLSLPGESASDLPDLLSSVAAAFLGWQLTMSLYGYLHGIQFAGQPAVEEYKARARALRDVGDPLLPARAWESVASEGPITLLLPPNLTPSRSPAESIATSLSTHCPSYLDLTVNGEPPDDVLAELRSNLEYLGNSVLGIPVKLRRAPAAYHSTEQSEMDGPPDLISLRVLAMEHDAPLVGAYAPTFLTAQAVGTWQAMIEAGRTCYLILLDASLRSGLPAVTGLLSDVAVRLAGEERARPISTGNLP